MVSKKAKVVIIGAGMAGLTAANKLYTAPGSKELFELSVVEGGSRIGGRINTYEFCGDRIEMGATWIHGVGGSPIYQIAQETDSLSSEQPWECMDGLRHDPVTVAEGGHELNPSLVEPISSYFQKLMDCAAKGKAVQDVLGSGKVDSSKLQVKFSNGFSGSPGGHLSLGSFLRKGLDTYWDSKNEKDGEQEIGNWSKASLVEAIFAMHENIQRLHTSADDLHTLDYNAESEYRMFPGEEITIAKGYIRVIEYLASFLPDGLIQLGRQVSRIEWQPEGHQSLGAENGHGSRPVKLHFCDGSIMYADHVIITVSLGVLKQGIRKDSCLFDPPLPSFKVQAISRLGYGVVDKLFLQLSSKSESCGCLPFPFLQMVFHKSDSAFKNPKIPWWMRRNAICNPIYKKSSVLLAWFAGKEAHHLESLSDEEIIDGFSTTISNFLPSSHTQVQSNCNGICNGNLKSAEVSEGEKLKFGKVLKTQWATDPLFLGSYSYVAVGSSGDDLDTMAEPLPEASSFVSPPLQLLFAGEATHRTHYSTTHGAYFSGLREANRLLQHYQCIDV